MFCQNCGAKIEDDVVVCPFCGFSNESNHKLSQKDLKIQELQEKIMQLEQTVSNTSVNKKDRGLNNRMMFAFIIIFPMAFLIFFFLLFFILANR